MDIKSAFLQGIELSRDIYIWPSPEAVSGNVLWKLKKCAYSVANASLYWYNKVKDNEKEQLRAKIGQIQWVAKQTRPDVMFDSCSLASNIKNATVQSIHEVNKVIRKLKSEKR